MELHVRYEGDDDPEKCSARKLARFDLATLHRSARATPPGVVLDPHADVALSPADDRVAAEGRLLAPDGTDWFGFVDVFLVGDDGIARLRTYTDGG